MDPNAVLGRWGLAVKHGDFADALEAASALGQWMSRGGFAPVWCRVIASEAAYHRLNAEMRESMAEDNHEDR